MGTNNISKAQRNKVQQSFQPVKSAIQFFNFWSATSAMNFLIQLKRNAIAERHFCSKLQRNLTSTIEISQRNAAILIWKRVNNLLKKAAIY